MTAARDEVERVLLDGAVRGLSKADRECIAGVDPEHLEGATGTLLGLVLRRYADVRPDGTAYLLERGLAVRAHLERQSHVG